MITGSLLDEAIKDAEAIRATALANAKQALEEAFSRKIRETKIEEDHKFPDRNITVHILKD